MMHRRRVLVAVRRPGPSHPTVDYAARLAGVEGVLTIFTAVPRPSPFCGMAPAPAPMSQHELAEETREQQRACVASLDPDVLVRSEVRLGSLRSVLLAELARGRHDVLVIGASGAARWSAALSARTLRRLGIPVVQCARPSAPGSLAVPA